MGINHYTINEKVSKTRLIAGKSAGGEGRTSQNGVFSEGTVCLRAGLRLESGKTHIQP